MEQLVEIGKILVWPVTLVVVLFLFREPLRKLIDRSKEVDVRGPGGVQATFRAAEAAAFLGAAEAQRLSEAAGDQTSPDSHDVRGVADLLRESATEENVGRLSQATVLWVDDNPNNNLNEREALKAVGIKTVISTSTEDALERVRQTTFDAIISDMGRYEEDGHKPQAGYELLDKLRSSGVTTPFFIYAGSNRQRHKEEAKKHGGQGSTNRPQELFQLVVRTVLAQRAG